MTKYTLSCTADESLCGRAFVENNLTTGTKIKYALWFDSTIPLKNLF